MNNLKKKKPATGFASGQTTVPYFPAFAKLTTEFASQTSRLRAVLCGYTDSHRALRKSFCCSLAGTGVKIKVFKKEKASSSLLSH